MTVPLFQPQNLVMMGDFPDCDVKVCDFEISRVIVEGTEIREILGTPEYVGKTTSPVCCNL
jgi:serine/threonine-protein kinase GIN4